MKFPKRFSRQRDLRKDEVQATVIYRGLDGEEQVEIELAMLDWGFDAFFKRQPLTDEEIASAAWMALQKDKTDNLADMQGNLGFQLGIRNCDVGDLIYVQRRVESGLGQARIFAVMGAGLKELNAVQAHKILRELSDSEFINWKLGMLTEI